MKLIPCRHETLWIGPVLALMALAPGPDDEEDRPDATQPGLVARYEGPAVGGGAASALVERVEPLPRLTGRAGESPDPGLRASGFKVRWSGSLKVAPGGAYTFTTARSSLLDLALTIDGKPATPGAPVTLRGGWVSVRIEGTHRGGEPAFELWWRGPSFADEPIAPRFFGHDPAEAAGPGLAKTASVDRGAVLAGTFACFRCHEGPAGRDPGGEPAPLPGPSLDGLASRVHGPWVVDRLLDEHRGDSGDRMPALFGTSAADLRAARTIAAYLSQGSSPPPASATPRAPAKEGEALVKVNGCLACHAAPRAADDDADLVSRVPTLDGLAAKWTHAGLAGFLRDPLDTRPHGRMPDFALTPAQAESLAAHLLAGDRAGRPPASAVPPRVAAADLAAQWAEFGGPPAALDRLPEALRLEAVALRQLSARQCLNCHEIDPRNRLKVERRPTGAPAITFRDAPTPRAAPPRPIALRDLDPDRAGRGCLATSAGRRGAAPRFTMSDDERRDLSAYIRTRRAGETPSSSRALVSELAALNCNRCHDNEGRGGRSLAALLGGGDAARYQSPPTLTRVGERLRPDRLAQWSAVGAGAGALRPWVGARMPGYGPRGARLAAVLSAREGADGPRREGADAPRISRPNERPEHAQLGRFLAGPKAFSCVNCHTFQGRWLLGNPADPTTRGPDLALVAEHLRPEYFERWMRDPARVRPETKMPQTIRPDGTVPIPGLTALPAGTPMDALWTYLSQGRSAPPPADEPTVLAAPEAGKPAVQRGVLTVAADRRHARGLAIGFEHGTLLFDADLLGPVAAWFGGFVKGAPENYFGMAWERAGGPPEDFPAPARSLRFQLTPGGPWVASPPPLESDLNSGPRFDGYQVGKSAVRLYYRLKAGPNPVRVTEDVRVERRPGWEGVARRLRLSGLPAGARVAVAAPAGRAFRKFSARGEPADSDPGAALLVYGVGLDSRVLRMTAPPGSAWQDGPRVDPSALPLLLPPAAKGEPAEVRLDWWAFRGAGRPPTAAELAALASDPPAIDDTFDDRLGPPTPRPARVAVVASAPAPAGSASQVERPPVAADRNVEAFEPVRAKFVRLTFTATKGGDAPGVDELEIHGSDPEADLALGGKATASSVVADRAVHRVEAINDGRTGEGHAWVGGEAGKGWVQVELPAAAEVRSVVWGRDRTGLARDHVALSYRVEVSTDGALWARVADDGDRATVDPDLAPGYRIEAIPAPFPGCRPSDVAFGPDGQLYALAMTEGQVWRTAPPPPGRPRAVRWTRYASGLNHPIGLAVVDRRLFVSQKPEVTELIDRDGDGTVETFRTVATGWGLSTTGWHEYCFGLAADREGRLYFNLTTGKFWTHPGAYVFPGRYRGSIFRTSIASGRTEVVADGCRVPNGIVRGPDGAMFFTDNQGDWIQACKVAQIVPGRFYGHPETTALALPAGVYPQGRSAVWLPYQYSRSVSGPVHDETGGRFGPFADQLLVGDVGYGANPGLMRVALEKVDGEYQGAAFRFADDQPSGCLRMQFGPDGRLYIASLTTGLARVGFTGVTPFAVRTMTIRPGGAGFVFKLTRPLAYGDEPKANGVLVKRYHYIYSRNYGSPQADETVVPVRAVAVSDDRTELTLDFPVEAHPLGMVYEVNLGRLTAAGGEVLRHNEAWYTVHRIPKGR